MPLAVLVLMAVVILCVGFIRDGYAKHPRWAWGEGTGGRMPLSVMSRWTLSLYVVLLVTFLIPDVAERLPRELRYGLGMGIVPLLILLGFIDDSASKYRPLRGRWRRDMSWKELRKCRQEKKKLRQRRQEAQRAKRLQHQKRRNG
jgi:hypothetical protein